MQTALGWNLISLPSNPPAPQTMEFTAIDLVGGSLSPFTGQEQFYDWQASWLEASVSLPPLTQFQAQDWIAFQMALRGQLNVFQMGDPLGRTPRGSAAGDPAVSGGGQTGYELRVRGCTANQPGFLLPGDWIQIGYRCHRLTEQADADSGGNANLQIWPQLRESPTDFAPVLIRNTKALWRLKSNSRKWSETQARTYGMQFEIKEALGQGPEPEHQVG